MLDAIETIKALKEYSGQALAEALATLPETGFSEKDLSDAWLAELRKNKGLYEGGWYAPPPHGVIATISKPADHYERGRQPSFRPEHMWPRGDIFYEREDTISVYASPVDRRTNLIGDFGLNIYKGRDPELKAHFQKVMDITRAIADHAQVGMRLKDIYAYAMDLRIENGFLNDISSTTDPTGTNCGHTIPLSYRSDVLHQQITGDMGFEDVKEKLRAGRKFLNSQEDQVIEPDMAFTIEPRLSVGNLPQVWFHLSVLFKDGQKEVCTGFDPVFEQVGMDFRQS